jgi:hypothetical protein
MARKVVEVMTKPIMHLKMSQVPFSKWRRWPKMIPEFLLHVEKQRGIFLTELGSGPAT